MVEIDEAEVIHVLQQEVAGIVIQIAARVVVREFQKAFERDAVMEILGRMQFETEVDAGLVERIEHRPPAPHQLAKAFVDQAGRRRRIRIEIRPQQRAAERHMTVELEPARCGGGKT